MKRTVKENIISYVLLLPAASVMIIFIFRPIIYSIILSLQEYRLGFNIREFIWFENYKALFSSGEFWSSIGRTFTFSTSMVIISLLSGLSNIPSSLYQASALDGSDQFQDFRYITWPLLSPTTLFMVIIMTKRALSSFDTIKVMTNGGPSNATQVLSYLLYKEAFQYFNIGYASAIAVIFFLLVLTLTLVQMKSERKVFYQ